MQLPQLIPTIKTGDEPLLVDGQPSGFQLLDFWRWSVSDLLSNATRGRLAEFIVATAAGIDFTKVRDEWGPFDLTTTTGIKVEVKSAAYLQTWFQRGPSLISFSTKAARHWNSATNQQASLAARHADVYVFCLLHHEDKQTINPLDLNQWQFYVLATAELNSYTRSQHSMTLKSLQKLAEPLSYNQMAEAIKQKNLLNK